MVDEITADNFSEKVLKSGKPVIIDFWASWCGPCRMLAPVLQELSDEMQSVTFFKIDTEKYPGIASQYGIMSLPTLSIFKGGQEVGRVMGFKPKPQLKQELEDALK